MTNIPTKCSLDRTSKQWAVAEYKGLENTHERPDHALNSDRGFGRQEFCGVRDEFRVEKLGHVIDLPKFPDPALEKCDYRNDE